MPIVLYLGTLGILTLGGFWGFAYKGMRELSKAKREGEEEAWQLASLLAKRRSQYVIMQFATGGEIKGFIVHMEKDSPRVFLDTRRATVDEETQRFGPKGKFRGPDDIEAVDLKEVSEIQVYHYGVDSEEGWGD